MTFVSVAQATRRLGIDAKTLRRWLADAQLALQSHPHDGRKKGVSAEDLHLLAQRHQRSLTPVAEEPPLPVPSEEPALPERLDALQTHLAALEQQVTALTRLLQQHWQEPAIPAASTQQATSASRPSTPASPAPQSRPAVKLPRKPAHVIPRVEYGDAGHYVVICPKHGLLQFEPDTPEWFAWVAEQDSFRFVGKLGHFSAHHEWRVPGGAWRAHRHIRNQGYHLRLAPSQDLTIAVLEQAAETLQAHLM
jgi:hypothetical protein